MQILGYLQTSISFYNNTIRNSHYADFTTKYPGEKIFLLALFYHLFTIYFNIYLLSILVYETIVYQRALLHVCFLHNPATVLA